MDFYPIRMPAPKFATEPSEVHGLSGSAIVRSCRRQGGKFVVGVRFVDGLHWVSPETSVSGPIPLSDSPAPAPVNPSHTGQVRKNLRRHGREPLNANVRVSWQDPFQVSNFQSMHARMLDFSESGMRIELAAAIPVRAHVCICSEPLNLRVSGSARYCRRSGTKFIVGLEIVGGKDWFKPIQTLG